MADVPNIPGTPLGAEPVKKTTGKVAPKKETVRITLPPKPSAAPTIKLPTLPPGGPTGAPAPTIRPAAPTAAPPRPGATPAAAPAAPIPGRPTAAAPRAAAPAGRPRPVAAAPAAAPTIDTPDKILAIAAMVAAIFAVGSALYLTFGIHIGT